MIKLKILNELNSVIQEILGFHFFSGEDRTLKVQIWDDESDAPYNISATATVKAILPTASTALEVTGTVNTLDRSIVTFALTAANTTSVVGGRLVVKVTEAAPSGAIRYCKLDNSLSKEVR